MEAATVPASPAVRGDRLRAFIGTYGLIAVLLALPVYFAVYDLVNDGDLTRIGNNLVDGISHGEVFMIGSFVAASLFATFGLTEGTSVPLLAVALLAVLVLCMLASGILNTMIERVGYRPLRNAPKLAPLITAVGFSFILQNVGLLWLGGSPIGVSDLLHQADVVFSISGVDVHRADVLAFAVTIPLVIALTWFLANARAGRAMRATAQDPEAARLMGIDVDRTISLTFLLGGMLAGAAGLVYALYQTTIWYFQGFEAG